MSMNEHVMTSSDQRSSLCHPTRLIIYDHSDPVYRKLPYVQCTKNRLTCKNYIAKCKIFQVHQLNSRRFPVFPAAISNSRRFPGVVDTHTHPFNSPLSRTTWVSRYQKGKTNLDFTEARDSEWQWHQLGHMQTICTSLQTDNHARTPPLSFYSPDALPAAQPTVSKY